VEFGGVVRNVVFEYGRRCEVKIGLAADTVGAGDPGLDKNVEGLDGVESLD